MFSNKFFYDLSSAKRKSQESESEEDNSDDDISFELQSSEEYSSLESESTSSFSDSDSDVEPEVRENPQTSQRDDTQNLDSPSNNWNSVDWTTLKNIPFTDVPSYSLTNLEKSKNVKPIDLYNLLVTSDIYDIIVQQTNLNAHKIFMNNQVQRKFGIKAWKDTNIKEVRNFLAIVLFMGLVSYPRIVLYWSKNKIFKNDFIPSLMSRTRFQLLLQCMHFADNDKAPPNDQLFRVRNMISLLERNFTNVKIPGELLAVDESIIPWQGDFSFKRNNPRMSCKYEIKLLKLCDHKGYTYTCSVYCGKLKAHHCSKPTDTSPYSSQIVLDLTEKYLKTGRCIATDSSYTSVPLARTLLQNKTHLMGTLQSNLMYNPKAVIDTKINRGEIIGCQSNDGIVVAKWKNKRNVLMLSTKHDLRMKSTAKKNHRGEFITVPEMVMSYNTAKQGIVVSHHMGSYFSPLQKAFKWYHKIAFDLLLNTAVVNALLLYKEITSKNMHIVDFRLAIIEGLIENATLIQPEPQTQSSKSKHHVLEEYNMKDSRNRKIRKRCKICYSNLVQSTGRSDALRKCKKVSTYCKACEGMPPLCLACFNKSH